jgi:hypothetical protein
MVKRSPESRTRIVESTRLLGREERRQSRRDFSPAAACAQTAPRRQGAAYGRERVVPADEGSNLRRIRLRAPSGCGTIARPEIAFRGKIK